MTIYFRTKRSPTGKLLLRRWILMRRVDKYARIEKKFKTYRRKWWWDEYRWNQRHSVSQKSNIFTDWDISCN